MASMIFASSPLSVQSFVKLRTNSNYSHSPCYVSGARNSYIQSSKSLFTKGDGSFSFSSTKFPRVASKYSPSFSIIKAIAQRENIYHFHARDAKTRQDIPLEKYERTILLIVSLPQKFSDKKESEEKERMEMQFLNDLRNRYRNTPSVYGKGFEVLGYMKPASGWFPSMEEKRAAEEIYRAAEFPIFIKVNDSNDRKFWNFLRTNSKNQTEQEQEFEKYLVDGEGKQVENFPWFEFEQLKGSDSKDVKPGMFPGDSVHRSDGQKGPSYPLEDAIAKYFPRRDYTN